MSFPRYPQYKDSGVDWLGQVPAHWEVDRLKRSTASCRNGIWGDEPQQNANDIPCVRVADFDRIRLRVELEEPTIRNVTESERAGRVLQKGDLLLEKSGGGEGQPVGCVVLYAGEKPAVCSNFVARVQMAPAMDSAFWRYVHAAAYAVRLNTRSIKQTSGIQNLDQQQYFDERAPFPPLPEQREIAGFLDRETGKIDALVAEQERLLELLKEKRQAVISHAVTRGLNPNAPLKPSGLDWLGNVPAHWNASSLRRCCWRVQTGGTPASVAPEGDLSDGMVWYTPGDFGEKLRLTTSERRIPLAAVEAGEAKVFPAGSVLIVSIGATLGKVAFAETESSANQQINAVVPGPDLDALFLTYSLSVKSEVMRFLSNASTIGIMNQEKTKDIVIALPPLSEQRAIVAHLDAATAQFDALTAAVERALALLQERRTALISAAVTGQIDVRSAAFQAAV